LRYGFPCAAVWTIYLLAFWPGILTEDSIEQWTDLTSGVIRGYHSPLQTSIHGLLTRVWNSPAIVVLAQILALSAAYTAVATECAARMAPRWLLATTTVLVSTIPANGFLVVTLWKDVPYAVALLWIAALTLRLARLGGRMASRWQGTQMAAALTAAATFRHNGLPTVLLFVVLLVWVTRAPRRPAWRVSATALVAILGIYLGLLPLLGVRPYHPAFRDQVMLHQVAAAMRPGTAYDQQDFAALGQVMPLANWVHDYRCESVVPTLAGVLAHSPEAQYDALRPSLRVAWYHAVTRSPRVMLAHLACVTGVIWNPSASFYLVATDIVPNGHGLKTAPLLPSVNRALISLLQTTSDRAWRAVVWGPATHLLVIVCGVLWMVHRRIDSLAALALALPLLHSAVLLAVIPSAEYRLQYPVVLFALVAPLIVASRPTASQKGQP